jgi:phenylpropionate dioxygenase-like ring-hydroxylating dioxygenase large terminal subunit
MTWVRNAWYVAAWDYEVDSQPIARTLLDVPVMLYRKLDGKVVAMRDACPHRMLPLSMGIKEGDSIRCKYHGLKLGPDGVAQEMPLKSESVNKRVCTEVYPVIEQHRFVWIWLGDRDAADPALVPDLWPCSADGWAFEGGHYPIACDYRLVIDNLMDLTHETYVHAGSIGQAELLETPMETSTTDTRVFVKRWIPDIDPPPFWKGALGKEGRVDRWQICEFVPPSAVIIDVGVAPIGSGATLEKHDSGVRGYVIDVMTPQDEGHTHYFWGMARNFAVDDMGFGARLKAQQAGVFAEDVEILEAQQRSITAHRERKLQACAIDQGGVRARQMIERLRALEGDKS